MRRNKKNREARRKYRRGKQLCGLGWGLFAFSMFLPAIHITGHFDRWFRGWECAWIVLSVLWSGLSSGFANTAWEWLYWSGFAVANLVMIASPWLIRSGNHSRKWGLTLSLLFLSAGYVTQMSTASIGAFMWTVSFWLVAAGVLKLRAESLRKEKAETPYTPPLPKTPEEMAAERELKDYLRGAAC